MSVDKVWLERSDGEALLIVGVCNLGRSSACQVVLKDRRASRRHALIQPQGAGEHWLVDFGSTNGTVVNGRRVVQPTLLGNGDLISIGEENLTFRKDAAPPGTAASFDTDMVTLQEVKSLRSWLLLIDIIGSTKLSNSCSQEELPIVLGRWFSSCKETIESCRGQINKYLGDGLLAYWHEEEATAEDVRRVVDLLCNAQELSQPRFRWVLHYGMVSVGGALSMGEASLMGREVNFAFRMEKVAGQAGTTRLLSLPAHDKLGLTRECREVGPFEVSGFQGTFKFRAF